MKFMWIYLALIGCCLVHLSKSEGYFVAKPGSVNFMCYFSSNLIGSCSGFMVSRNVVLTAAICVHDPGRLHENPTQLNVIVGATYRHLRRGIKVQVTKILIPDFPDLGTVKDTLMDKAPAVLLLKRKVPDIMVDVPVRAIEVQYSMYKKGEKGLTLHEQCFMPGWHFHGVNDVIYPGGRFLLQRFLRVQFLYIAKSSKWCDPLTILFQKKLDSIGFEGQYDPSAYVCVADPDRQSQPCMGMAGSPLICKGKAVGMMMSHIAQWRNCSGFSNIIHIFNSQYLINFMHCVSSLFSPDTQLDWNSMQSNLYSEPEPQEYDYVAEMYDKLVFNDEEEY